MYTLEEIGEFYQKMGLKSLTIKQKDFEISMSSEEPEAQSIQQQQLLMQALLHNTVATMPATNVGAVADGGMASTGNTAGTKADKAESSDDRITIYSPMVGIFDDGEATIEKPYVKKGDSVKKGDVVGTIEAMKMFNDIVATHDGIIDEICVKKGEMVEFHQPLFKLKKLD